MFDPVILLHRFMDLAAAKNRFYLYEHELFYILDIAKIGIPDNMYIDYKENTEEKFQAKFIDNPRRYVIKPVSDSFRNMHELKSVKFGISGDGVEGVFYSLRDDTAKAYVEFVKANPESAADKYKEYLSKPEELLKKVYYDISGAVFKELIYFIPKFYCTELFVSINVGENIEVKFGDYNGFKNNIKNSLSIDHFCYNFESVSALNVDKILENSEEINHIENYGDKAPPLVQKDDVSNVLTFCIDAVKRNKESLETNWKIDEFSIMPFVCFNKELTAVDAILRFSAK